MEPYWSKTWEINLKLYSLLLIMELLAISSLQKFLWLKLKFLRCLLLVKFMFTNLKWAELTVASGKYFYGYFYLFIQQGKLIFSPQPFRTWTRTRVWQFFFSVESVSGQRWRQERRFLCPCDVLMKSSWLPPLMTHPHNHPACHHLSSWLASTVSSCLMPQLVASAQNVKMVSTIAHEPARYIIIDGKLPKLLRSAKLPSAKLPSARLPSAMLPSARLPSARLPSARLPSWSTLCECLHWLVDNYIQPLMSIDKVFWNATRCASFTKIVQHCEILRHDQCNTNKFEY